MTREIILRAPIQRPDEGSNIAAIVLVRLTHNDITPYVTWVEGKDGETYWETITALTPRQKPISNRGVNPTEQNTAAIATPMETPDD